jgi:hypothetical protein
MKAVLMLWMKQIICFFCKSYNTELDPDTRYIKMHGRKIYEFALTTVPAAMKVFG